MEIKKGKNKSRTGKVINEYWDYVQLNLIGDEHIWEIKENCKEILISEKEWKLRRITNLL